VYNLPEDEAYELVKSAGIAQFGVEQTAKMMARLRKAARLAAIGTQLATTPWGAASIVPRYSKGTPYGEIQPSMSLPNML